MLHSANRRVVFGSPNPYSMYIPQKTMQLTTDCIHIDMQRACVDPVTARDPAVLNLGHQIPRARIDSMNSHHEDSPVIRISFGGKKPEVRTKNLRTKEETLH